MAHISVDCPYSTSLEILQKFLTYPLSHYPILTYRIISYYSLILSVLQVLLHFFLFVPLILLPFLFCHDSRFL